MNLGTSLFNWLNHKYVADNTMTSGQSVVINP